MQIFMSKRSKKSSIVFKTKEWAEKAFEYLSHAKG
jgi:hypothetical protein